MKCRYCYGVLWLLFWIAILPCRAEIIKFVYASDSHYGLFRSFRGANNVSSASVNHAMLERMNRLPMLFLPDDGGVGAGTPIRDIDFVVNTGDISNRMEDGVQSATRSWEEFEKDWYGFLSLKDRYGKRAPLYLLPGNHDVSNAIGFPKPLSPRTDVGCLVQIYNRMMHPQEDRTVETYSYVTDKVNYSFTLGEVHFVFIGMWPDSQARRWLEADMMSVPSGMPVVLFTHDQPDVEAKHFINPNTGYGLNEKDRFENLLSDTCSVTSRKVVPVKELRDLSKFLFRHSSIKAYFHGNSNYNEFYRWKDPDGMAVIPVFRVDSPMKGEYSSVDESLLSFQLVCIDTDTMQMTVRECLWNADSTGGIRWGDSKTISLK